ncbi:MAG: polyprenyl synthetase family protein [Burkholderiaceae bacterium]
MKPVAAFDFGPWCAHWQEQVEQALSAWLEVSTPAAQPPEAIALLVDAMRYAVLDGGKRLRPLLVLAAYQALVGNQASNPAQAAAVLRSACAIELIHAYSLVHDDLPCMDNDLLRRGKPTVHVQFGQANAMLAGDALQAKAFELLTLDEGHVPAEIQAKLCRLLALASGSSGMAGGQAIDLNSVGIRLDERQLRDMHRYKTGALLHASVMMGAACAGSALETNTALSNYGWAIGLAFQVVDDILDVTADSTTLGKTAGKDAEQNKPTYVSVLGLQRSRDYAQELLGQALSALGDSSLCDVRALRALAEMVVNRSN